jgi:hypothetical protein
MNKNTTGDAAIIVGLTVYADPSLGEKILK